MVAASAAAVASPAEAAEGAEAVHGDRVVLRRDLLDQLNGGEWIAVLPTAELVRGKPVRVDVAGTDVLLYRDGERILAVANRCTHQGAPLHKGQVRVTSSMATVACPVHGSVFQLTDGRVMRGPATTALQTYETRVEGESVEVRSISP